MSISIKKINNVKVRPIKQLGGGDERPVKGAEISPDPYTNIFITARKKSGKTTILAHMLKAFATKDTTVVIFSSTIEKDKNMIAIVDMLEKKGIEVVSYMSIREEGVNVLDVIVRQMQEAEEEEEEPEEKKHSVLVVDEEEEEEERKPRKSKYLAPKYIIVFDDIAGELRNEALVSLLKKNRHLLCKVIISSQYVLDLKPESRQQIDIWILLPGQNKKKLEAIWKDSQSALTLDNFEKIYYKATEGLYNFLYYYPTTEEYRFNFSHKIKFQ